MTKEFNWPQKPSPLFPKETIDCCPRCGSVDVESGMRAYGLGSGRMRADGETRAARVWRSGDPATLYIKCKKCKFQETKPLDYNNL